MQNRTFWGGMLPLLFWGYLLAPATSAYAFSASYQQKIFLLSKDYSSLDTNGLRINNMGMYFAKKEREGLRLTIEGAQLLHAKKRVISLTKEQAEQWMQGEDIPMEGNQGFVILHAGEDILGCGMLKNNLLRNMTPKERRLRSITQTEEENNL